MLQVSNLEVICSTRTKTFSKKKLFSFEKFSKLPNKSTVIFLMNYTSASMFNEEFLQ